jgi:hypothetical protein
MHVEPVDPEVEHLLFEWSEHTKRIKTLAGKHYRSTRDYQYGVESLAEGKFFVEMPDKGRIDVGKYTAESPKPGIVKTYPAPNGKNVKLTVKMDQKREKWICDGRVVRVVDDSRSTYEELPIPPSQQGANMIDGPLPFLLGMPPEKAKARYHFKILKDVNVGPGHVWIEVTPKSAMDAAEWVRAYVLLNLSTYLPDRVSLFNPAGTTETVYIFRDIETKRSLLQNVFGGDPFRPNLFGYKREVHAPPAGDPTKFVESPGRPMPHFIGDSSNEALRKTKQLKDERYRVEFKRGPRASSQEQEFHIEAQDPPPETPLRQGQTIVLRYYDKVRPGDQQQR